MRWAARAAVRWEAPRPEEAAPRRAVSTPPAATAHWAGEGRARLSLAAARTDKPLARRWGESGHHRSPPLTGAGSANKSWARLLEVVKGTSIVF
eukprot:scaffold383_cov317-Prasinococcus_capsulatus_cf.AAC.3